MNTPHSFTAGRDAGAAARRERRAGRGRIIVLGDESIIESVAQATHRPTTLARHMYDVIGEIAQAGALDGPDAVVASVESLGPRAGAFLEAVRRIDPGVELIAVNRDNGGPERAAEGFDSVLSLPLDGGELEAAVCGVWRSRQGVQKSDEALRAADRPSTGPAPPAPRAAPSPEIGASDPPSRAGLATSSAGGSLGDVDLVAAMIRDPESVCELAVQLIAQETGWRGLKVSENPAARAACVAIAAPGSSESDILGYLVAESPEGDRPPPSPEQLLPWAEWIVHWLLLARTTSDLRRQAMTDQLTGAYNRRFFDEYLARALEEARALRQCVSLLLFDIDDFKVYNDRYGHAAGDEILVETVKLLRSVIRPNDRVCRIGGDEFVVIFHDPQGQRERGSSHPDDIQSIARRFQQQICRHRFPKLSAEAPGTLTISGGLATYPWDGADVASLLEQADQNALLSKRAGKNAITFGPGANDVCAGEAP
ncbi:MAG: diguanylate cyclase [Phycisphaerales bacterium]|nr:diguanylate cyclase [Phycisphaerales bacterium]